MADSFDYETFKAYVAIKIKKALQEKLTPSWGVDTGQLKGSITATPVSDGIEIEMLDTGLFIEYGTPPHIIRAKNKKVLSDGKNIFGKEVKHPGTHPFPFIRTTMEKDLPKIIIKGLDYASK